MLDGMGVFGLKRILERTFVEWKGWTADLHWRISYSRRSHTRIVVRGDIWGCIVEGVYLGKELGPLVPVGAGFFVPAVRRMYL
jgi:hypothetical protein